MEQINQNHQKMSLLITQICPAQKEITSPTSLARRTTQTQTMEIEAPKLKYSHFETFLIQQ